MQAGGVGLQARLFLILNPKPCGVASAQHGCGTPQGASQMAWLLCRRGDQYPPGAEAVQRGAQSVIMR